MKRVDISLGRSVLAGLIAGLVGALLANLTFFILSRQFGQSSDRLNWLSIARASMITCCAAGFAYRAFVHWTKHPTVLFALTGLALATIDSLLIAYRLSDAGFARIAIPLHFVVTLTALILIPTLAGALPGPTQVRSGPPPLPVST